MVQKQIVSSEKTNKDNGIHQDEPKLRFPEFNDNWETLKLGDFLEFISTNSFSRAKLNLDDGKVKNIHYGDIHTKYPTIVDVEKEEIPFININEDTSKFKKEQFCKDGDLIIADASEDYADIGKAIELINVNIDLVAGLHTILARDKSNKTATGFKGYLFLTDDLRKKIKINANGISVLGISKNNIANLDVRLPSKEEQEKISSFLRAIDKKIELLEKKHLLITYEKEYYLNLFFNENTGKNSNNFKKVKLGDILSLQGGFNFDSRMFDKYSNNPVIKIGDIPHNLDLENFKGNFSKQNCGEKYKVKSGDILIALSGATFGKSGKVSGNGIAFINQRVAKFICKKCDTNYIFQLLNSSKFKKYLNTIPTSSAQPNISNKDILNYPTFIPELNKQIIIGNFLGNIDNQIELIEDKVFHMKRFKKFLLQKMFV